ncbi:hypothetical protein [Calothrix sp. PCC 6303]|uniref:hypothetical protein n=1 Tax=Calothrix sp. PCC 6303 TaxID=1170562 RepID=UPI0002A044C7|nr:hypothetical protein [Calothrix sp. PCC 6303]AFZ03982.1 hypothetical protein Cal6303_5093 [Calothrix sp. PCC 6303]
MLKRLLLIFGLFSVSVGGILFYLWNKTTYAPAWYTQTNPTDEVISAANTESGIPEWMKVNDKVVESLRKQRNQGKGKIELSADEVNTLVAYGFDTAALDDAIADNQKQVKKIVLGTNTKFQDEKMVIGAMVDLKQLVQHLSSKGGEGAGAAQAILSLPFVSDRAVYIEMEGKPIAKEGNITLEPDARVTIAGFNSTLPDLAKNLKIPVTVLEDRIVKRAISLPMKVEAIDIVGDNYGGKQRLVIKGTATSTSR